MFVNDPEGLGSVRGWVIKKEKKKVHYAYLLNTQCYKVQIKSKWSNPRKGVVLSPTPQYCSYCKGSLWVAFDSGWPTSIYSYFWLQCFCSFFLSLDLRNDKFIIIHKSRRVCYFNGIYSPVLDNSNFWNN